MTTDATISINEIDAALANVAPKLTVDERRLAVAIYRLLATGQPVTLDHAATATDIPAEEADRILRSWPAVFRDKQERIVGFGGLAVQSMPHRLRVAGTTCSPGAHGTPFSSH